MRGTLRWARADLRARRGQAALTIGVVAGVVAALVVAIMLLEGSLNPWRGLFERTHGADVLVYFSGPGPSSNTQGRLGLMPGIEAVAAPYQAASATLEQGATKSGVQVTALDPRLPSMSAPLVVAGTWLRSGVPDGAVIEASFAAQAHIGLGDVVTVESVDAPAAPMRVIGIADTADQGFYPQWTPGLIWVLPTLLAKVEPSASETENVIGVRLANPTAQNTALFVQNVYNYFNNASESSVVERFSTRQEVMNSMASNDRLLGLLLGLFGSIALVAAPCAIANVTAGRVLMQRQDIAMLKALGFTPGQVVRMLLATQTALGVAGAGLGLLAAWLATSHIFVRPPDGVPVTLTPLPTSWMALIAGGTVLTVAIATVIPAWWAGMVSPVAAVRASPPRGHLSLIARLGLLVRLPAPLVLGARDSLTRRLPAALTVLGVAIPMVMITVALTCWSTIDGFTGNPARIGQAAALTVSQGGLSNTAMLAGIRADPDVSASYEGAESDTLLPGQEGTFIARAMGSSARPYPFQAVQGHMYQTANEAVAGQGFLDLMHLRVGDWTTVTINGVYVIFKIVGRVIEPDNNGDVLDFGLDALTDAGGPAPPQVFYSLVLKPGVSPAAARAHLLARSHNRLDVQRVANPADGLAIIRVVIVASVVILAVIGLANLLTATAVGLRDHLPEIGVLEAMGLTPRQVMATLVVNTTIMTAIGVTGGMTAGLIVAPRLINMQGQTSGIGSGIAAAPSVPMVAGIWTVALASATAAALLLALRTTRICDPVHPRRPVRAGL